MPKQNKTDSSLGVGQAREQQNHERVMDPDAMRMFQAWRDHFASLDTNAQQQHLHRLMVERLYWKIIYYMRRYPEKMMSTRSTYSDRCVGHEELMQMMGSSFANGSAEQWLYNHHVPVKSEAVDHVIVLNAQIHEILSVESRCAIASIGRHFELSHEEIEILGSLVILFSDPGMLRLLTVVWADFSVRMPTVDFMGDLLTDTPDKKKKIVQMLSKDGKLRRMRLVIGVDTETFQSHTPQSYTRLIVEQPVLDAWLDRLADHEPLPHVFVHHHGISRHSLIIDSCALEELEYVLGTPHARLCLVGQPHSGRRTLCVSIALQQYHKKLVEVDICRAFLGLSSSEMESYLSIIMREALLVGGMLMLRFDGVEDDSRILSRLVECQSQLALIVSYFPGEIILLATHAHPIFDDIFGKPNYIHITIPDRMASEAVWKRTLEPWSDPSELEKMAIAFSRNYQIPVGKIHHIVSQAMLSLKRKQQDELLSMHHVLKEIHKSFDHQLGTLAEVVVSDVKLSGVVLPAEAHKQVDEILEYAMNLGHVLDQWGFRARSPYGNSLSVLLSGPPGTGKTLLAGALANELGKVLYRVDVSRIVDKYIGETEKNLGRIFDEASKAQAIILFDEADSLFSKRTDVKSSNDRYANLEINFLLQKLESYQGITILTTNLSKSIDEAFRRRLRFIIEFPMPDQTSRMALWKRMMPPGAPLSDDIRWSWLAKTFEMSGGYIRNAVLKAAIAASAAQQSISMAHLVKAAEHEARSMGTLMRVDAWDEDE